MSLETISPTNKQTDIKAGTMTGINYVKQFQRIEGARRGLIEGARLKKIPKRVKWKLKMVSGNEPSKEEVIHHP